MSPGVPNSSTVIVVKSWEMQNPTLRKYCKFTSIDYEGIKHNSIHNIKIEMWFMQNREKSIALKLTSDSEFALTSTVNFLFLIWV